MNTMMCILCKDFLIGTQNTFKKNLIDNIKQVWPKIEQQNYPRTTSSHSLWTHTCMAPAISILFTFVLIPAISNAVNSTN